MPQIWLTYDELGAMFRTTAAAARDGVIENDWPRRRCSDGLTRAKLPPAAAHEFMLSYALGDTSGHGEPTIDAMVARLRGAFAQTVVAHPAVPRLTKATETITRDAA